MNFGFLEVNSSDTIFSLRQQIVEEGIPIHGSYVFVYNNEPVTYPQEQSLRVLDVLITTNKKPIIFLRQT